MARVSKPPDERRVEFIEAAQRLFSRKGYDETAVSDIVHELKVAQGTFYLYFKSKEEVLEAVIEHDLQRMREQARVVAERSDRDARAKLEGVINVILSFNETRDSLFKYIHLEKNALLHDKFMRRLARLFTPIIHSLLVEGIAKRRFRIRHRAETAEILLLVVAFLNDSAHFVGDRTDHEHKKEAAEYFLCKILGMKEGSFTLGF
jgi:AcrR family transcriptional regulator